MMDAALGLRRLDVLEVSVTVERGDPTCVLACLRDLGGLRMGRGHQVGLTQDREDRAPCRRIGFRDLPSVCSVTSRNGTAAVNVSPTNQRAALSIPTWPSQQIFLGNLSDGTPAPHTPYVHTPAPAARTAESPELDGKTRQIAAVQFENPWLARPLREPTPVPTRDVISATPGSGIPSLLTHADAGVVPGRVGVCWGCWGCAKAGVRSPALVLCMY